MEKDHFLNEIKKTNPRLDFKLIEKAFDFAKEIYAGKTRLSGQALLDHCAEIALDLAQINLGSTVVAAALLHEALEATAITRQDLDKKFGEEVAFLVEGVTNTSHVEHLGAQRSVDNLRKLFLATAKDIRVVMIKLINRYHGMKTIKVFDQEKQQRLARETLEVYAPLAYRLGMQKISGDLEDIIFPILFPEKYNWLLNRVKDQYQEREKYLKKLIPTIKKELEKADIEPLEIHYRAKHYFSLYRKLQRYQMDLSKIYDLVAMRIIVKGVDECYATLGIIHKLWKPLLGRIKDYIAIPKPNGYRSLHTTVFCPEGKITEFQIKTPEMHREAEYGIAAHWYYSERKGLKDYIRRFFTKPPAIEMKLAQQLRQWQKEIEKPNSDDFFQSLKIDFFENRIFVFTPKGDIVDLPEGATPVDFAYQIHGDIGAHCQGARVDTKMVALDTPLQNGQVVEIITQKQAQPSRDWLRFVKTSQARNRIKNWLKKNKADFAVIEEIEKEAPKPEQIKRVAKAPVLKSIVEVAGDSKIATALANCCHPQPPDQIAGYITLNHRITVHRVDCKNLERLKDRNRLIEVNWKN